MQVFYYPIDSYILRAGYLRSQTTHQETYLEAPGSLDNSPSVPQPTTLPSMEGSETTTTKESHIKPPAYTPTPYLDSPPPSHGTSPALFGSSFPQSQQQPFIFHIPISPSHTPPPASPQLSYSHDLDSESEEDDNVPLSRLVVYPRDEPPAYSTIVRQSYRDTLLPHLSRWSAEVGVDEEAMLERIIADDVSFKVESMVAMAVVIALLVLTGLMVGWVFLRG